MNKSNLEIAECINSYFGNIEYKDYIINIDNSVDLFKSYPAKNHPANIIVNFARENYSLRQCNLSKLPIMPRKIGWNLLININNLTSLENLPKYINGNLYMMFNKLEHSKENFEILYNTFIGGVIEGDEDFMLGYNRYVSLRELISISV